MMDRLTYLGRKSKYTRNASGGSVLAADEDTGDAVVVAKDVVSTAVKDVVVVNDEADDEAGPRVSVLSGDEVNTVDGAVETEVSTAVEAGMLVALLFKPCDVLELLSVVESVGAVLLLLPLILLILLLYSVDIVTVVDMDDATLVVEIMLVDVASVLALELVESKPLPLPEPENVGPVPLGTKRMSTRIRVSSLAIPFLSTTAPAIRWINTTWSTSAAKS